MPANPINVTLFKNTTNIFFVVDGQKKRMHVDGTHPRRFSSDPARKAYYSASRQQRYREYVRSTLSAN